MGLGKFQTTTLTITVIMLVIFLFVITYTMMKTTSNELFPPTIDNCPDFWTTTNSLNKDDSICKNTEFGCCSDYATAKTDTDGTNCPIKCYNVHSLGKVSGTCTSIPTEMDFGTDLYLGTSGTCNKQTWAQQCGITWDGITNGPSAC